MTGTLPIVERLRENIIADAFESHHLTDGVLADRLIRERHGAADLIEKLTEAAEYALKGLERGSYGSTTEADKLREALELAKKA